jgi:hypothetical protein
MSATACVSAAEPDLQHQIVSSTRVSLSVTLFAIYAPVVVLESAPKIEIVSKLTAVVVKNEVSKRTQDDTILKCHGHTAPC